MTAYQFRSFMAVLWLIAANTTDDRYVELACSVLFAAFSFGLLFASLRLARDKANG